MQPAFTIRVYGIFIKDGNILLSQERYGEVHMLKFPGGGLEYGESTLECLQREMTEEYALEVAVKEHFYTTDFFVKSVFHAQTQVMSIYYFIEVLADEIPVEVVFPHDKGEQFLVWKSLGDLNPSQLTFPIDQKVIGLLQAK
jgi:8-oxo-dGTP diphosphatase